nr:hypothetical protein MarFTME_389 [Marseillevirus futianmevirus]
MEFVQLLAFGCFDCWELHIVRGGKKSRHAVASFKCEKAEELISTLPKSFTKAEFGHLDETCHSFVEMCRKRTTEDKEIQIAAKKKLVEKYEAKMRTKKGMFKLILARNSMKELENELAVCLESFRCGSEKHFL